MEKENAEEKLERSWKANGYRVKSWGDLAAVIAVAGSLTTLVVLLLSVVAWGLKLEDELNIERQARTLLQTSVAELKSRTRVLETKSILPVARAELDSVKSRVHRLERNFDSKHLGDDDD